MLSKFNRESELVFYFYVLHEKVSEYLRAILNYTLRQDR